MIGAKQKTKDDGVVTLSVKIPAWMADQLNAIAKMRGEDVTANHLLALCLQFIVESAKHTGPIANEFLTLLNMMKMDASWNKAFNFSRIDAQLDVAQAILILQQHDGKEPRKGFGLTMVDKPFMGEATYTTCVDDILERVAEVSMPGLYRQLNKIGQRLDCISLRETLTLLSEYMDDSLNKEEERAEMPAMGTLTDYGRPIEYGQRTKRKKHRTPDEMPSIKFEDWEGEHIGEHVSADDIEEILGGKPFGVEP